MLRGSNEGSHTNANQPADDAKLQFAFIEKDGKYYMWNASTKTFSNKTGHFGAFGSADAITWTEPSTGKFLFKFDNDHVINLGGSSQITIDGWGGSKGSADAGNQYTVEEISTISDADWSAIQTEMNTVNITYSYKYNGVEKFSQNLLATIGVAFPAASQPLPYGVKTGAVPTGTVTDACEGQTYDITISEADELPFLFSTSFADAHWYCFRMRPDGNNYVWYDAEANPNVKVNTTAYSGTNRSNYAWAFIGNPVDGFTIVNKAAGEGKNLSSANNPREMGSDGKMWLMASPYQTSANDHGPLFSLVPQDGSTTDRNNLQQNSIKTWGGNDVGSAYWVEDIDLSFEPIKEAALAEIQGLSNISTLFSSDDLTKATTDVNNASSEDDVNSALTTLYQSAQGKKFSILSSTGNMYMEATSEYLQVTNAELKKEGVFEVVYAGNGKYKLKGVFNDVYVCTNTSVNTRANTTDNAANAGQVIIGNCSDPIVDNKVYFAFNLAGNNALHFSTAYTSYNCVWAYTAGASNWIIAPVTEDEYTEMTTTPDWDGLAEAINAAEARVIGTGLGKYTAEAGFADALASANEMNTNRTASKSEVDAAIASISTSKLTIHLPQPGSFLRIKGAATNTYISGNGTANSQVPLTSNADEAVLYYTSDGKLVSPTCGMGFSGTHSYTASATIEAHTFTEAPYAVGAYLIKSNYSGSQVLVDWNDGKVNRWNTENDVRSTWYVEEVDFIPVKLSVVDGKSYSTFYSPVAVTLPSEVQAYVVTKDSETHASLTLIGKVIPANTGVVLYSKTGATNANLTIGGEAGSETSEMTGSAATIAAVECATLQNGANGVGLYKYTGSTLKGFKAYLPASSGIKSLVFNFEEETLIKGIEEAELKAGNIYDMSGRQVGKAQKGLYIQNGKKFIVK